MVEYNYMKGDEVEEVGYRKRTLHINIEFNNNPSLFCIILKSPSVYNELSK